MRRALVAMSITAVALVGAALLSSCGKDESPTTLDFDIIQISPGSVSLAPGQQQKFSVDSWVGPAPSVTWEQPAHGDITPAGLYTAPYVVDSKASDVVSALVTTTAGSSEPFREMALVTLIAGRFPGADSCAGPGQPRLPRLSEYVAVDSLPEAIVRVAPSYPDSARAHGVQGLVMIAALVCVTGNVLDVRVVQSIPELDESASDAVRQWQFRPAVAAGQPVAVWVHVPVRYTLHGPGNISVETGAIRMTP
jgi:TonB family protein